MKKLLYVLLLFIIVPGYAQIKISTGMGIDLVHTSSLEDYINDNFYDPKNEMNSFNKSLSLFGEVAYSISDKYQLGVEFNYSYFLHNSDLHANYELVYSVYKPSLIGYYVLPGDGYEIKFGAGLGYRYVSLEERIYSRDEYSSSGIGVLAKAVGNTGLGDNFYGYISFDIRYDYLGEPEGDSGKITNASNNEVLNLNKFSVGIKLGVSYFFE